MTNKIITTLEGRVPKEHWKALQDAYHAVVTERLGIMPMQTFLMQSKTEPEIWRITSIWPDMETLDKLRSSGEVPAGIRVFREAKSEPALSVFEVREEL